MTSRWSRRVNGASTGACCTARVPKTSDLPDVLRAKGNPIRFPEGDTTSTELSTRDPITFATLRWR